MNDAAHSTNFNFIDRLWSNIALQLLDLKSIVADLSLGVIGDGKTTYSRLY
ncbi:unnamed protein product [Amoebophrya sp. A25]|nr:unnamed protein product [Amoebophrya sp. A25]|eukprot:GSA25T00006269001.1